MLSHDKSGGIIDRTIMELLLRKLFWSGMDDEGQRNVKGYVEKDGLACCIGSISHSCSSTALLAFAIDTIRTNKNCGFCGEFRISDMVRTP